MGPFPLILLCLLLTEGVKAALSLRLTSFLNSGGDEVSLAGSQNRQPECRPAGGWVESAIHNVSSASI